MFRHVPPKAALALSVIAAAALLASCAKEPNFEDYIGPLSGQPGNGAAPTTGPTTGPASRPTSMPALVSDTGPLDITITQAVFLALANNQSLAVEKLTPAITRTTVEQQW
jgi:hypothetical protein